MDPGAVLLALLGSPNLASRRWVFEQYDATVQTNTRRRARAAARPSCGSRARPRRSSPRPTRNQRVGALDPWLGAAISGRRSDAERRDHRRAAARRHELPELRRPDAPGGVLAARRRRCAASATRAARSVCRSPAATSRSTTNRRAAPSRRRRRSASSGCSRTSRRGRRPGVPRRRRRRDPARRRGDAGPRRQRVRARWPASRAEDGPPSLDLAREAALQGFIREAIDARARRVAPRTCRAAGSPWPSRSARSGRGLGATLRSPSPTSPAVELFGESPSRLVVTRRPRHAAALALLARQHGLPVEELGTVGGDRLADRARRGRRDRRGRGARQRASPTRSTCRSTDLRHAWEHGLPRALGSRRCGRLMCGVFGVVAARPAPARRRPRSPRSGCSRSSTAARSRPASPSATASS